MSWIAFGKLRNGTGNNALLLLAVKRRRRATPPTSLHKLHLLVPRLFETNFLNGAYSRIFIRQLKRNFLCPAKLTGLSLSSFRSRTCVHIVNANNLHFELPQNVSVWLPHRIACWELSGDHSAERSIIRIRVNAVTWFPCFLIWPTSHPHLWWWRRRTMIISDDLIISG